MLPRLKLKSKVLLGATHALPNYVTPSSGRDRGKNLRTVDIQVVKGCAL
jgi:hypothetical protein